MPWYRGRLYYGEIVLLGLTGAPYRWTSGQIESGVASGDDWAFFWSRRAPIAETHGHLFQYVVGPFRSYHEAALGARWRYKRGWLYDDIAGFRVLPPEPSEPEGIFEGD